MSAGERQAALEAIAYGPDADVRPSDRLRALELLAELPPADAALLALTRDLSRLSDAALDTELDAMTAARVSAILADETEAALYPQTAVVLQAAIEARLREASGAPLTTDELHDLDDAP